MDSRSVKERVCQLAEQAAIDHGVELVHAEVAGPDNRPVVRVFIDKPGGVTHRDCSEVSQQLGTTLDVEDFIHAAYTLEVSSPGLERGLYGPADYERFAGSAAKIKSRDPVGGQRNFRGRVRIPFAGIVKANLEIDVEREFRLAKEREEIDRHLLKNKRR